MFNGIIFISQRQRLFTSGWGQGEGAGSFPKATGPQQSDASPQSGMEGCAGASARHTHTRSCPVLGPSGFVAPYWGGG